MAVFAFGDYASPDCDRSDKASYETYPIPALPAPFLYRSSLWVPE